MSIITIMVMNIKLQFWAFFFQYSAPFLTCWFCTVWTTLFFPLYVASNRLSGKVEQSNLSRSRVIVKIPNQHQYHHLKLSPSPHSSWLQCCRICSLPLYLSWCPVNVFIFIMLQHLCPAIVFIIVFIMVFIMVLCHCNHLHHAAAFVPSWEGNQTALLFWEIR